MGVGKISWLDWQRQLCLVTLTSNLVWLATLTFTRDWAITFYFAMISNVDFNFDVGVGVLCIDLY